VEAVGVAEWVKDEEERYQISVFVRQGLRLPTGEFMQNARAGNFEGLLVAKGEQKYEVKRGELVEVTA
jgi:hypothetical protein